MNDPQQRSRSQTSGSGGRTSNDGRPLGIYSASGAMSRAERFEDEKRRIIDSCFSKKDPAGSILESYITHIRIVEDAAYPSSPPPPNSTADNKKPRIIVVAVRKSGRVRMHKARENANGTFSIGKTWHLDDLSTIESYLGGAARSREDEEQRRWAGGAGFTVTLLKPYFWMAGSQKEKEFFIASLAKIFRKYTGGKLPELIGFDQKEMEQLLGGQAQLPRVGPPAGWDERGLAQQPAPIAGTNATSTASPRPLNREPRPRPEDRDLMPKTPTPLPYSPSNASVASQGSLPTPRSRKEPSPIRSNNSAGPPPAPSPNDQALRKLTGSQSVEAYRNDHGPPSGRVPPNPSGSRFGPGTGERSVTPESNSNIQDGRIGTPPMNGSSFYLPPERRRPPISGPTSSSGQKSLGSESIEDFRTPLASPDVRRGDGRAPSRNGERNKNVTINEREIYDTPPEVKADGEGYFTSGKKVEAIAVARNRPMTPEPLETETPKAQSTPPPKAFVAPPVPSSPAEPFRPGLGPMIKKKSNLDIANTFRKAATAYNAFKPRAGGAGERQPDLIERRSGEPDGINGVVPAPSLLRNPTQDNSRSATPEQAGKDRALSKRSAEDVPEVKVTRAPTESTQQAVATAASMGKPQTQAPGKALPKILKASEISRPQPRTYLTTKHFAALDIDPNFLQARSVEIEPVLSEFGWGEGKIHELKIDALEAGLRKEIGRVEAGSWLGHLDQKDERVETVERMLDRAIAECDELEGLLALYSVELSSLNEDVAFIESQSQGLQIQTANQKLLQAELQNLLKTRPDAPQHV